MGISPDSAAAHRRFKSDLDLRFPLIADEEKRVIRLYQARRRFGLGTRRITYVIDLYGVIQAAFQHEFAIDKHIEDALDTLRELSGHGPE